ncbi:gag-protease polyprotein [Cucumis melo var. makuwa]|uniref:Gag-protease polyprotein n=1 Tax=Cucumis melo var. makuwa TaxID=1194695 RepID=A0A5A7SH24_CUCMM|nr:gag-protease polyprotein [Cucumis melo var. makuwa]TYK23095.1 gag-protease polyprotein [Cucumis melo var. makuwa]
MEQRYHDMLRDALAPFHVAQQTLKCNPKTFDESLEDPTKDHMWLASIETIFCYMKCPNNQKVQCTVFFFTDRGTTSLRYAKQQEFLNLEQGDMTMEQYDVEFDMLSSCSPEVVMNEVARTDKFVSGLRLDLQGFVQAFRPTTHADALCLPVDMRLH